MLTNPKYTGILGTVKQLPGAVVARLVNAREPSSAELGGPDAASDPVHSSSVLAHISFLKSVREAASFPLACWDHIAQTQPQRPKISRVCQPSGSKRL